MVPAVQEVIGGVMHVSLATTILAPICARGIDPIIDDLRQDERVVGFSAICGPDQRLNRSLPREASGDEPRGRLAEMVRRQLSVDPATSIPRIAMAAFGATAEMAKVGNPP